MNSFIILLLILFAIGLTIAGIYNKIIRQIEAVNNNNKQIDIQLDRRFKVFESLINTVKNYMDYEKSTLKEVVSLRNQAQQAQANGNENARIAAEDKISSIASKINLVFEQYPDLKANTNALQLQEEIVSTENKLAFAKQAYNDSIEIYNATKKSFPDNLIVSFFSGSLDKNFIYWNLTAEKTADLENYTVHL